MSLELTDLYGKKIALLLWFLNENQDFTAVVVSGKGFQHNGNFGLHRGPLLPPISIPLDLLWRAQLVPEHLRDILSGAEYCLEGTIAELGFTGVQDLGTEDLDWEGAA